MESSATIFCLPYTLNPSAMKYLTLLAGLAASLLVQSQSTLEYNKRFVECEDQWVAFRPEKDSSQVFGFIYIDAEAGLTLQAEGSFTIGADGHFIPKKMMENGAYKIRLQPNNVKVAILPPDRLKELGVSQIPDWLHFYKDTKDTIGRMVRWGYYYNHWGESAKALTYLEKAYKLDPAYKGVEFELAYAYNALEQFDKAVPVLTTALERPEAEPCLLYKELCYAQMFLNRMNEASASSLKGIEACEDVQLKAEMAYNMAYQFYKRKDKENCRNWAAEVQKWTKPGNRYYDSAAQMLKAMQ